MLIHGKELLATVCPQYHRPEYKNHVGHLLHRVNPLLNVKPKFLTKSNQAGRLPTAFNTNQNIA